jgi:hypothetical protein
MLSLLTTILEIAAALMVFGFLLDLIIKVPGLIWVVLGFGLLCFAH